ncbi:RNA polymerase sigma factor [Sphingobacterium haloxyli]|uniref:RNA polymerase subunit sigma-70 n=1 Tax=Sphingobacterium haloxyli TaxID=2100533 RepID=A0A2S9J5V0_9SPHI|nr:RNA polymerase sigma-70 factor [Sphingobacterium haloxyli]PRD48137.1 RNA polymerase subunit sigma-70 [Sphingobacterium haloxyli]
MTMHKSHVIGEEKALLHALRKSDTSAFQRIYNQYYSLLYIHAYNKLRDRDAAKDIVHDLFANLWQRRESLTVTGKLSSYLYASVRNRILDYISKERSKASYLASLTHRIESQPDEADYHVREKMLEEQIETVLLQLPPRIREIFELSRKQYLSHKEISQKLNLSEQSVRSYIKDALRALRMKLSMYPWILFVLYCKLF